MYIYIYIQRERDCKHIYIYISIYMNWYGYDAQNQFKVKVNIYHKFLFFSYADAPKTYLGGGEPLANPTLPRPPLPSGGGSRAQCFPTPRLQPHPTN